MDEYAKGKIWKLRETLPCPRAVSINGETISKSQEEEEEEEVRDKRPLAEEAPRYRVLAKHVFCFYSYSVTPVEFVFLVIRTDKASFEKGIQKMRSFIVKVSRDINWGGKIIRWKKEKLPLSECI